MRLRRLEAHAVREPQRGHECADAGQLSLAVGPAGAAHHHQHGVAAAQRSERPHGHVQALQRLDAPHEQQHGLATQVEGAARPAAVAGGEERVLHPGGHDLDAPGRIAVEPAELQFLLRARHADGVGAADDLALGLDAAVGLGIAPLGLHPGERVERHHQRAVERVLDLVTGDARQPVVAVHQVDAAGGPDVLEHAVGELVDHLAQCLLG